MLILYHQLKGEADRSPSSAMVLVCRIQSQRLSKYVDLRVDQECVREGKKGLHWHWPRLRARLVEPALEGYREMNLRKPDGIGILAACVSGMESGRYFIRSGIPSSQLLNRMGKRVATHA